MVSVKRNIIFMQKKMVKYFGNSFYFQTLSVFMGKNRFERFIFKASGLGQKRPEWHWHTIHKVMPIHTFHGYKAIAT